MDFDDTVHYENNILNGTPDFKDTFNNQFNIGESSDAINNASSTAINLDILETQRTPTIDIGAYQHIIFEEDEE